MTILFENICPQFTSAILLGCKTAGITTVTDFILHDPEDLAKIIKSPYKDVVCIRRDLLMKYAGFPQSADSVYVELLESISILNTGSIRLNELLCGGIYTGEVTEIYGSSGAGKTQFCFSVVSHLILETGSTVLYLDTNNSFEGKRMEQMILQNSNENEAIEERLQKVKVINVCDIYKLFEILDHVKDELFKKEDSFFKCLRLVVIDSIAHLLSPCFGEKYLDGLGLMNCLAQQFKPLCCEHMLSVLVCNSTVQGKEGNIKPALGSNWKYVPSVSLCISKLSGTKRKMITVKSCRSALFKEAYFSIMEGGLSD